jgi:hypothetical protein
VDDDNVQVTNDGNGDNFENQQGGTEKPNSEKSPIPVNEYGLPPSLIPLQKYPTYPYNLPFYYDSYGNYQTIQYPVLPPISYYNPQDQHLPPINEPMFEVRPGARSLKSPTATDKKLLAQAEQKSAQPIDDSYKNNSNKNVDVPDIIPELPFHVKKN